MTARTTILGALALAAACSAEGKRPDPMPLEIGVVASLTGDLAAYGKELEDTTALAFDEINGAGGVLGGRALKALVQDDGTKPEGTKRAYAALVQKGVPVVLGTTFSGGVTAIADQVKAAHTLTITPTATSAAISTLDDGGYLFRTAVSDAVQGVVLAQLVADAQLTRLCVVHRDDTWGTTLKEITARRVTGLLPQAELRFAQYAVAQSDFDEVMAPCADVRDTAGTGVLFLTFVDDGALVLDAAERHGWSPARHKFFFGDGIYDPDLLRKVRNPAFLEGALGTAASGPDPGTPVGARARAFEDKYRARFGRAPAPFAANIYDAAYVAAAAVELAGDATDKEKVASAIRQLSSGPEAEAGAWATIRARLAEQGRIDYQGASGNVDFDPATGDVQPPNFIAVWTVRDGALARVRIDTVGVGR